MNDPKARQTRFNAESLDQWGQFAEHRRMVSGLLGSGGEPGSTRLCVLGAGNANDLDLPALLARHRQVHLVDLDARALAAGTLRQGVVDHPGLIAHGSLDLTGMLDAVARWSPLGPITDHDLQALIDWPGQRVSLALPGRFDLVASTCLLSQIIGNAFVAVGGNHPRFLEAVRAIRLGHLRLLTELALPGGQVVLINDVVSSEKFPALANTPNHALPGLLKELSLDRGLIHGMNPAEILELFRTDPVLAARVESLEVAPPWRWKLHQRVYLVWGLRCRLKGIAG